MKFLLEQLRNVRSLGFPSQHSRFDFHVCALWASSDNTYVCGAVTIQDGGLQTLVCSLPSSTELFHIHKKHIIVSQRDGDGILLRLLVYSNCRRSEGCDNTCSLISNQQHTVWRERDSTFMRLHQIRRTENMTP